MKHPQFKRAHTLGVILVAVVATLLLTSCVYEDPYYGGYGDGYYAPSGGYAVAPAPAPYYYEGGGGAYRSTVYESRAPYYRTSPHYNYSGTYANRYYGNEYRYRGGGGSRYYESNNRYRKTTTYKRDYDSNQSPAKQRENFKESAKDKGRYNSRAEDSLEKDRDREQSREKKKR